MVIDAYAAESLVNMINGLIDSGYEDYFGCRHGHGSLWHAERDTVARYLFDIAADAHVLRPVPPFVGGKRPGIYRHAQSKNGVHFTAALTGKPGRA